MPSPRTRSLNGPCPCDDRVGRDLEVHRQSSDRNRMPGSDSCSLLKPISMQHAVLDDHLDVLRGPDVVQRIALDDRQVGDLAGLDAAVVLVLLEGPGDIERRRLEHLHRRHAGLDVHDQRLMHQQRRHAARRVRAFLQDAAGLDEAPDELVGLVVADLGALELLGRVALEQLVVGIVGDRADRAGQAAPWGCPGSPPRAPGSAPRSATAAAATWRSSASRRRRAPPWRR